MNLKSLLLSSDEKTVRVLRRVLSDLEIEVEHCATGDDAIRLITRQRFEAIVVDGVNPEEAGNVFRGAKASPVNKRALGIVLVESSVGLKGGFDMGAHFVLHKPLAVERAKSSFRAVRALMKRERRQQLRVTVQVPVECFGSSARFKAQTVDISEGGMAIQFIGHKPKENSLRFSIDMPGLDEKLELEGELAWEGKSDHAGVRFKEATDEQVKTIRKWMNNHLSEPEDDDPPVKARLSDLSVGGCYLKTSSPFPRGTRVVLSIKTGNLETRAGGIVLVAHPEFGMGVEFLQATPAQQEHAKNLIKTLRASKDKTPELQVEPDGLETPAPDGSLTMYQAFPSEGITLQPAKTAANEDKLVELFRHKFQVPVEVFLEQMRGHRHSVEAHSR